MITADMTVPHTNLNLLNTSSALSYSNPLLRICWAMKDASTNTGGLFPISLKLTRIFWRWVRWRMILTLSPTMTKPVVPSLGCSARAALMDLAIPEWMPPHRPLSEETAITRWLGFLSSGSGRTSAFSNRAGEGESYVVTGLPNVPKSVAVPAAPWP